VKPTLKNRRVLFAGIVILGAILIFYLLVSLLADRERLQQQVDDDKNLILKQREILGLKEFYIKQAEQADKHLKQVITRLLPGDNSNVASAEIMKVLKDFADQNGVDITLKTTLQEEKVPDTDFLTKVSVRIELNCNLEQLVNFLTAIENYDKFLKVDELIINSYRLQKKYEIRPRLVIAGYIHSPNPKPAAGSAAGEKAISTKTNRSAQ
jgi:hypothetical protein